jgi:2-polyprenyl-6-methoxyphenol hydroxylase-like FAD-dependent oxidoreductase
MNETFDVVIVGGGPAGSAAGTLLAKAGRSVLILEKEKFRRFYIGESMLPTSSDILQRMCVKEKVDRAGLVPTVNAILAGNEARGFDFKWRLSLWSFGQTAEAIFCDCSTAYVASN